MQERPQLPPPREISQAESLVTTQDIRRCRQNGGGGRNAPGLLKLLRKAQLRTSLCLQVSRVCSPNGRHDRFVNTAAVDGCVNAAVNGSGRQQLRTTVAMRATAAAGGGRSDLLH
jgi:hypothetical protein